MTISRPAYGDLLDPAWNDEIADAIEALQTLTGSHTADLATLSGAWTAYTPVWSSNGTQPALGNGSIVGAYNKYGNLGHLHVLLTIGSTSTFGTGSYRVSVPGSWSLSNDRIFGVGFAFDSSASTYFLGGTVFATSGTLTIRIHNTAAGGLPTSAVPFTWATSDKLYVHFVGEVA